MAKSILLNRPLIQKVAGIVSRGVPLKQAALVVGISEYQLKKWMKVGGEMRVIVADTGGFPAGSTTVDWMAAELHQEVELAHAKVVERYSKKINAAAKKSWQAAAWWLQRRAKEDFSTQVETSEKKVTTPGEAVEQFVFHCPDNGRGT